MVNLRVCINCSYQSLQMCTPLVSWTSFVFRFPEFTEGEEDLSQMTVWLSAALYSIQMILTDQERQLVKMME